MTTNSAGTILIVDDTPANIGVIVDHLEERSFRVVVAQDGLEALERARRVQPDLILLDVMMPGIDGFETCRRLKAEETTRLIPVIFMSALSETQTKVEGFEAGGVDYVTKPVEIAEVVVRVQSHLALRAMQMQLEAQNDRLRDEIEAHGRTEATLRQTNLQFDAALNSMMQGMIVWNPDHCVQLVNRRFFAMCGIEQGGIRPGMTVCELVEVAIGHGLFAGQDIEQIRVQISHLVTERCSLQLEMPLRPDLLVRVAGEPMANGGAVITWEDVTEKRANEEQIAFLAQHDPLTGLANRRLFQDCVNAAVARLNEGEHFAVLFLDLDRFKAVNDTLGHAAGDELLRLVAKRLRHCVRDRDVIARLGGDEFAIVLRNGSEPEGLAASLATRLVKELGAPYDVSGNNIVIGVSIGIVMSTPGLTGAELLSRADVALYRAKEERGTFAFFEATMDEQARARFRLDADLRQAIRNDEFEVFYQPIYSLTEFRVSSFEALVRWNSPTCGLISSADFISLADQTGLIVPIGEWVLRTACTEAMNWPSHVRVAVNLSAAQFKGTRLVATVRAALAASGLPPCRLELEITETVLLLNTEAVMTTLRDLHVMGARISLADFGTGYSSLSYLRRCPFDKIKIDRSLVKDLQTCTDGGDPGRRKNGSTASRSAAMIVRAISGLGEDLGISTTAEGVETVEQLATIRDDGCTEVQGYFISPPRPAAEIPALLSRLDSKMPGEDAAGVAGGATPVVLQPF